MVRFRVIFVFFYYCLLSNLIFLRSSILFIYKFHKKGLSWIIACTAAYYYHLWKIISFNLFRAHSISPLLLQDLCIWGTKARAHRLLPWRKLQSRLPVLMEWSAAIHLWQKSIYLLCRLQQPSADICQSQGLLSCFQSSYISVNLLPDQKESNWNR